MALFSPRATGNHYEALAKTYLLRQGLTFIEQNFHVRRGEIDLIFRHNDTIVFVEVKYRKSPHFGHAAEMVTRSKMNKLWLAAQHWLRQHHYNSEQIAFRFDVIAIHQQGQDIEWIQNVITQG